MVRAHDRRFSTLSTAPLRAAPLPKNIAGGVLSANIEFTANSLEPQLAFWEMTSSR